LHPRSDPNRHLPANHRKVQDPGGVERPGRVDALRAIDASACPRSWRTFGPRRLRRQSEPALVTTRGDACTPPRHQRDLLTYRKSMVSLLDSIDHR
jgi:hypothetical protein